MRRNDIESRSFRTQQEADRLTKRFTSFELFADLVMAGLRGYSPTLQRTRGSDEGLGPERRRIAHQRVQRLANLFDRAMIAAGSHVRAFRPNSRRSKHRKHPKELLIMSKSKVRKSKKARTRRKGRPSTRCFCGRRRDKHSRVRHQFRAAWRNKRRPSKKARRRYSKPKMRSSSTLRKGYKWMRTTTGRRQVKANISKKEWRRLGGGTPHIPLGMSLKDILAAGPPGGGGPWPTISRCPCGILEEKNGVPVPGSSHDCAFKRDFAKQRAEDRKKYGR